MKINILNKAFLYPRSIGATFVLLFFFCNQAYAQDYSVVIGVDGLGCYGIHAASTPSIDSLANGAFGGGSYQGTYAQNAFAGGIPSTETQQVTGSGPGWASILTGVWVNKHQVDGNQFGPPEMIPNFVDNPSYLETLEETLGGSNVYTASSIHWTPIDSHIISTVDDANSSMDFRATGGDASTASTAASQIAAFGSGRSAIFVHFDDVDSAGHGNGDSSPYNSGYIGAVATVDTHIGTILNAIESRPEFDNENWQIIITSDHGYNSSLNPDGNGDGENGHRGHGGQTIMERTVPVVVASKTAIQGFAPTSGSHTTSHADVASTALDHFGIKTPGHYDSQPIGNTPLEVDTGSLTNAGSQLVSHLNFDGNTDSSLAGAGASVSGIIQFVPGIFGQAITVNNYGDGSVQLNDDLGALFGATIDFSFSIWLKYDSFTGDPSFFSNKNWNSGQNTGINLAINNQFGAKSALYMNTKADAGSRGDVNAPRSLMAGVWQNVVVVVDRDGHSKVFVDGILIGARDATSIGSFDGSFNWRFLNDGTGSYSFGSITGLQIDEFAAWDRLLTNDEVSILAQSKLILLGDVNGDSVVNLLDVDPFVSHLTNGTYQDEADINRDGNVNLLDVNPFVALLTGS